jgi:hypothetical protein
MLNFFVGQFFEKLFITCVEIIIKLRICKFLDTLDDPMNILRMCLLLFIIITYQIFQN